LTVGLSLLCCLLIIYTTDVRLLLNSSALPFPKLGNLLPMTGLYLGGPIVLLVLSLRFHFLLLRLWGSMAALPAVFPDGQTLEKDGPWYLMGLVRRHFRWQGDTRAALAVGCILFIISLGVNRGLPSDKTGSAAGSAADPRRWAATIFQSVGYRPYADLTEASLSTPLPKGTPWTDENVTKISGAH